MQFLPHKPKTLRELVNDGDFDSIRIIYLVNVVCFFIAGIVVGVSLARGGIL